MSYFTSVFGLELTGVLGLALALAGLMTTFALGAATWRLLKGPTVADRVVALDLISMILVAFLVLFAMASGIGPYMDAAIVLSLVAFLGTVAFARFLERSAGEDD